MRKYLEYEIKVWTPFLSQLPELLPETISLDRGRNTATAKQLSESLSKPFLALGNKAEFNNQTQRYRSQGTLPPPSSKTVEGELVLALSAQDMASQALAVYVHFIVRSSGSDAPTQQSMRSMYDLGGRLIEAAHVARVLPYHKASPAKMAGAVRTAENHVSTLATEVKGAEQLIAKQVEFFGEFLKTQSERFDKVEDFILDEHVNRKESYIEWITKIEGDVETRFTTADNRVAAMERANGSKQSERQAEFERLQDLFQTQLRLRAPVRLWEERENLHNRNSKWAMWRFIGAGGATILFGLLVPFFFGDYIASSFFETYCTPSVIDVTGPETCGRVFSAKGPLTITGLLLVMSLLMWVTRLQYRIHLSERHLSLDASEKKAFAETYLAMKEGDDVGKDNEAIVLASLFRPTQDGIIKDDETGMDLSTISLMAKQLGRN